MIGRYAILSQRIRQELAEIKAVVTRVEWAMAIGVRPGVLEVHASLLTFADFLDDLSHQG